MSFAAVIAAFFRSHGKVLGAFGVMQGMQLLLPLLALPLLAHRLEPHAFGLLMYFCLFPPLVAIFVDWGISLAGCRAAAQARGDDTVLSQIWASACSGRILLLVICTLLALFSLPIIPHASEYPAAYAFACAAGMVRGLNPTWFFQGAAFGLPLLALADVATSLTILTLVYFFVHTPAAWPFYLIFLTSCKLFTYGIATIWLCKRYKMRISLQGALTLLRTATPLCGSAFALMFCYNGSQIILGFFLNAADMGILVAVNKMIRALASVINPFTMTLFPELCIWRDNDPRKMQRALRLSLALTTLGCLGAATLVALLAPWLIALALGPSYAMAIPALRLAVLATPFMVCNNVLGQQILLPFNLDKKQSLAQAAAALLSLPIAALLGAYFGLMGGALLPVCTEIIITLGLTFAIIHFCPEALNK